MVITYVLLIQGEAEVIVSLHQVPHPTLHHFPVLGSALGLEGITFDLHCFDLSLMGLDIIDKRLQRKEEGEGVMARDTNYLRLLALTLPYLRLSERGRGITDLCSTTLHSNQAYMSCHVQHRCNASSAGN